MRDYELVLVLDPDLTSEKQKKLITKIKKIITEVKGKELQSHDWGKKDLAFPVKKKSQAYFFLLEIQLPFHSPAEIEKRFKLEEELLRYLLVKTEKSVPKGGRKKGGEKS